MTHFTLRGAIIALALTAAPVMAQVSTNVIATEGDWTAFSADNPKECWAVSPPKSVKNTDENGNPKEVNRGDIRLYIAYRPGSEGEVSFAGGYPFAGGSTATLEVGGRTFNLFTEGENAWTGSPAEDKTLIAALRAGASATVKARSARGTRTTDTFSLSGVTAITNKARAACP